MNQLASALASGGLFLDRYGLRHKYHYVGSKGLIVFDSKSDIGGWNHSNAEKR